MTSEEHLKVSDILAFRERHLSATDHTAATRHLLLCPECRSHLPLPTADELWRAVMGDDEIKKSTGIASAWTSANDYLAGTIFGQFANRNVVVPGLLLIAIFGFSLFLMVPRGVSENENLVATVGDTGSHSDIHSTNSDGAFSHAANADVSTSSSDPRRVSSRTPDRTQNTPGRAGIVQIPQRTHSRSPASSTRSLRQADARGNVPCGGQRSIGLGAKHTDAGLLLTWEKLRGAVTYNVYLSDLDERLIDHFETAGETSHLVTAALDSETVYRLRLIANLENGERVVSESQNLKLSDLSEGVQSPGIIVRKKTSASVRCVEAKQ